MSSGISLCAQAHCHDETDSATLVPVFGNLNTTTYADILYNCVLPNLWQQVQEGPHIGVMANIN